MACPQKIDTESYDYTLNISQMQIYVLGDEDDPQQGIRTLRKRYTDDEAATSEKLLPFQNAGRGISPW